VVFLILGLSSTQAAEHYLSPSFPPPAPKYTSPQKNPIPYQHINPKKSDRRSANTVNMRARLFQTVISSGFPPIYLEGSLAV